ncbi:MAG TPA: DUF1571 domain-containing protein [Planctomycetaceae bacterium]|nr:DUF1571 domain-containing protein [Planctomycetaceae bacterium]
MMYSSLSFPAARNAVVALFVVGTPAAATFVSGMIPDHYGASAVSSSLTPTPVSPAAAAEANGAVDPASEKTLQKKLDLLRKGSAFLNERGSYSARMSKQEVVGGELLPEHVIWMKCRQQPFSVYLSWETGDPGREVLYIEGANNGRLIGHDGGWKARLPAFSLSPESSLAMRDARYPVTRAGVGGVIDLMIEAHETDLQTHRYERCEYDPHVSFDGRDCHSFTTTYKSAAASPIYRKSVTLIDREWNIPLSSHHYEWPKSEAARSGGDVDATTLIEAYEFTEIDFNVEFNDEDFDRQNDEYAFR